MRGGVIGSISFLAFLLFHYTNGQNILLNSQAQDLKEDLSEAKASNEDVILKSTESDYPNNISGSNDNDKNTKSQDVLKPESRILFETYQPLISSKEVTENKEEENLNTKELKSAEDEENDINPEGKSSYSSAIATTSNSFSNSFAKATAISSGGYGSFSPYGTHLPNSASSLAQAHSNGNAQAAASSQSNSYYRSTHGFAPPSPSLGLGSLSLANANAQSTGYGRWNPFVSSPDVNYASGMAQEQSDYGNSYGLEFYKPDFSYDPAAADSSGWVPYGPESYPDQSYTAEGQASMSLAFYEPGRVRQILPQEYIIPQSTSGYDEIVCRRAGDLYSILTLDNRCLICTCRAVLGQLRPVCTSCDACFALPLPEPEPEPIPVPIPVPPPEPQLSCSPLPEDTPFQNPLNPCQICICAHVYNAIGQLDIQIDCQDNPECRLPADIIPIPPMPEPPVPVPMPLCEKFPSEILFPHPTESCRICKCVVEILSFGIPEQRIICIPIPECEQSWLEPEPYPIIEPVPEPEPWPIPEPLPSPPEPWPIVEPEPWPIPDILPPAPEPWPIIEEPWPIPDIQPPESWEIIEPLPPMPEPWYPDEPIEPWPVIEPLPEPWPAPEYPPWPPQPSEPEIWPDIEPLPPAPEPWPIPEQYPPSPEPWPIPEQYPPAPEPWPIPEQYPPAPEPWPIPEQYPPAPEPWPIPEQYPPAPEPWPIPEQYPPAPEPWPIPEQYPPTPEPWPIPEQYPPAPEPWPIPEQYPPAPEPWPIQEIELPEPMPLPEPQPLPWPPVLPDASLSPLPGPPPHQSCQPYPPNMPFQHPWDECRVCVCSEFHAIGITNIEVNCYTKPSCCVELPFPEPYPEPLPLPPPIQQTKPQFPALQLTSDQICQYQDIGSEFISPEDVCKVCSCQLFGNYVAPVCRRSRRPECAVSTDLPSFNNVVFIEPKCRYRLPNQPYVVDCNVCSCQPVFNYVIARCTPQPSCDVLSPLAPGGSYSNAEASASANYNSYGLGDSSLAQASSNSLYTHSAEAIAHAQSNVNTNMGGSSAYAESLSNLGNKYPYGINFPGSYDISSSAQANAVANVPNGNAYPYYDENYYGTAHSQAAEQAAYSQAMASATQNSFNQFGSQAFGSAEALGNSQYGLYGGYPYYNGMLDVNQMQPGSLATSELYQGLYQKPVTQTTGMYQAGMSGWDNSVSEQGISLQSLQQISAISGRPLIRSGPGLCNYAGDKYHHNCQACFCFQDRNGNLFTLCLGNPCSK
ncbi:uncharacterized protein LOC123689722 isoform X3 [Pieris rapae]|uniref:uncharacterized protein LOC123689722 isoform X3 n=1 Tax=Pieris rapae TaxID=64459 RepID=UPI001E27F366|nr:uncharacterized protein LOC123689722 isoform X3 [Pieris rapae]